MKTNGTGCKCHPPRRCRPCQWCWPHFTNKKGQTLIFRKNLLRHSPYSTIPPTPSFPLLRHSREGGNLNVPLPQCPRKTPRHSREGGNPQFPRMREFNENTKTPSKPTRHIIIPTQDYFNVIPPAPSFPLLRHSRDNLLRHSRDNLLRHSREGGNPQFPRMREFNENTKTPSKPTRHIIPTQDYFNVIPALAGMTECFLGH